MQDSSIVLIIINGIFKRYLLLQILVCRSLKVPFIIMNIEHYTLSADLIINYFLQVTSSSGSSSSDSDRKPAYRRPTLVYNSSLYLIALFIMAIILST